MFSSNSYPLFFLIWLWTHVSTVITNPSHSHPSLRYSLFSHSSYTYLWHNISFPPSPRSRVLHCSIAISSSTPSTWRTTFSQSTCHTRRTWGFGKIPVALETASFASSCAFSKPKYRTLSSTRLGGVVLRKGRDVSDPQGHTIDGSWAIYYEGNHLIWCHFGTWLKKHRGVPEVRKPDSPPGLFSATSRVSSFAQRKTELEPSRWNWVLYARRV